MRLHFPLSGALLFVLAMSGCEFNERSVIEDNSKDNPLHYGGDLDDSMSLSLRVKRALKNNPQTMHARILVSTKNDTVKLSGYVDNNAVVAEAERIANQVAGVRFVVNALYIR